MRTLLMAEVTGYKNGDSTCLFKMDAAALDIPIPDTPDLQKFMESYVEDVWTRTAWVPLENIVDSHLGEYSWVLAAVTAVWKDPADLTPRNTIYEVSYNSRGVDYGSWTHTDRSMGYTGYSWPIARLDDFRNFLYATPCR